MLKDKDRKRNSWVRYLRKEEVSVMKNFAYVERKKKEEESVMKYFAYVDQGLQQKWI